MVPILSPLPKAPGVSVIVPAHNSEGTLANALRSALAQDLKPLEIICVDDGSRDATAKVARGFRGVRLVRTKNRGVASARNLGIRLSRHPLIAFLDSDDEWLPGKLRHQVEALRARPAAVLCATGVRDLDGNGRVVRERGRERSGRLYRDLIDGENFIVTSTVVLRRAALRGILGPFPVQPFAEDYHLWLSLSRRHDFYVDPGAWVDYRLPDPRTLPTKYPETVIEGAYQGIADLVGRAGGEGDRRRVLALMEFELAAQRARSRRIGGALRGLLKALRWDPWANRNMALALRVLAAAAGASLLERRSRS